jgi:hypothetical protein
MHVESPHFRTIERASAAAAENGELVAGFVDGAIPINAFRNGQRGAARSSCGDEFGSGARAEAGEMRGVVPRRKDLQNAQAVLAVGDKRERAGGYHADFHVVHVVKLAFGSEDLIELRSVWFFDIHDGQALLPC